MLPARPGVREPTWRPHEMRLKKLLAQIQDHEKKDDATAQSGKTLFQLAAAYGAGLVRERPFPGKNLDVALMAAYVILRLGGFSLYADEDETVAVMRELGKEEISANAFAGWLEKNSRNA